MPRHLQRVHAALQHLVWVGGRRALGVCVRARARVCIVWRTGGVSGRASFGGAHSHSHPRPPQPAHTHKPACAHARPHCARAGARTRLRVLPHRAIQVLHGEQRVQVVGVGMQQASNGVGVHGGLALLVQLLHHLWVMIRVQGVHGGVHGGCIVAGRWRSARAYALHRPPAHRCCLALPPCSTPSLPQHHPTTQRCSLLTSYTVEYS